jgi:hypothetical protein
MPATACTRASRPPARPLALRIAAAAAAQRPCAAPGPPASHAALLVALAQEVAPSRRRFSELVGLRVGTTREGATGGLGGSEAAAGELRPARQWPAVTSRPAAPPGTRLRCTRGHLSTLRAHAVMFGIIMHVTVV